METKMMRKLFLQIIFILTYMSVSYAQNVSNVAFYQEGKNVVVTYSLDKLADVSLCVSTDGGVTFSAPLKHVSGDVGKNVSAGSKRVIWDVLAEQEKLTGDNIVFMVSVWSNKQVRTANGQHNGHNYVDLGLPSGTLWATCNVGAKSINDFGKQYKPTESKLWGSKWRIPTYTELQELHKSCTWEQISSSTFNGFKGTGPNGNHIYLVYDNDLLTGGRGFWSSSKYTADPKYPNCYWCFVHSGIERGWGIGVAPDISTGYGFRLVVNK